MIFLSLLLSVTSFPVLVDAGVSLPAGWVSVGCIYEGDGQRIMNQTCESLSTR